MRNLLAFLGAALLTFAIVGWYLDWYKVKSTPANNGHNQLNIDVNRSKIIDDVQKGEEKVHDLLEKSKTDDKGKSLQPTTKPGQK